MLRLYELVTDKERDSESGKRGISYAKREERKKEKTRKEVWNTPSQMIRGPTLVTAAGRCCCGLWISP